MAARREAIFVKVTLGKDRFHWFWAEWVDGESKPRKHIFHNCQIATPGSDGPQSTPPPNAKEGIIEMEDSNIVALAYETRCPAPGWFQFRRPLGV